MKKVKSNHSPSIKNKNVCPDYDEDCLDMSLEHASWCFMGCQNHPCNPNPNSSLGIANGYCPILNKDN